MKVAYVVAEFPSLTETFILRELSALASLGTDLSVFALRHPSSGPYHPDARPFLKRSFYPPRLLGTRTPTLVWRALQRHPARCFVLFRHSLHCWAGPAAFLKSLRHFFTALHFAEECRRLGVEHVHAHFAHITSDVARVIAELCDLSWSASVHAWDIYAQRPGVARSRLAGAAFVVSCTDHGRRLVQEWFAEGTTSVVLIRHGLPLDSFEPGGECRLPLVVAVGRLVPKKGYDQLIEACSILNRRNVKFRCAIVGDGSLRTALQSQIHRLGLGGVVHLEGPRLQDAVRSLLASATVFVAPSVVADDGDRDGLPNSVLEALALETPVIVTHASAATEVVRDGWNGFVVPPGNPEALAGKIETVLRDPALRARMGRAGREAVAREFDASRTGRQLLELFQAARKRRSRDHAP